MEHLASLAADLNKVALQGRNNFRTRQTRHRSALPSRAERIAVNVKFS
jgi:hypothetical protein